MNITFFNTVCCAAFMSSFSAPAIAQNDPELDIQKIDCRSMLKMGREEQDFTLIYLHGFMSGKAGEMMFSGPTLRKATDAIYDECIDNPSSMLIDVFTKHR